MVFDPLTLMIASALLLVATGLVAAWRLRSGGFTLRSEILESDEPPVLRGEFDDVLTGLGNRLAFERSGAALLGTALANGQEAALLVFDLDRFDAVNATHGRAAGDRLLVAFARLIHDYLPPASLVCRLGADTFAAIVPAAGPVRAQAIADDIRLLFAHLAIESPRGPLRATVSIGIAGSRGTNADIETLLQRADLCLDRAKAGGRDRVAAEAGPDASIRLQRRGAA